LKTTTKGKAQAKHADAQSQAEASTLPPTAKLTTANLEGYLWSAADILRGSIDSSDYKNYIFGLLFLKRLSDRFDEEYGELAKQGHDPDEPDEHEFFVPKRARWSELKKQATVSAARTPYSIQIVPAR